MFADLELVPHGIVENLSLDAGAALARCLGEP
jgi:hypothetical protein